QNQVIHGQADGKATGHKDQASSRTVKTGDKVEHTLPAQVTTGAKAWKPPYLNEDFARTMHFVCLMENLENVEGPCPRKRKMKFEASELEVFVEEANQHLTELQQRNLNITRRNMIWEDICAKVNAVGQVRRTAEEVKKRWQDLRRRTKEKVAYNKTLANKTGGGPAEESPLSATEQQDTLEPETMFILSHPRRRPAVKDIDIELVQEQKRQSAALEDGLQLIVQELRSVTSATRALRQDTRAIVAHSRQLVSAVSGLTMAINTLTRGIEDAGKAVGVSGNPSGPSFEEPTYGRESARGNRGSHTRRTLRQRRKTM
uniref:Myb/SANT-like DNA-binding domain-containing protein n=1 Tax=Sphaeramia orbicularis TaxID=375764 RepID=A0A672YBY4_9TELE